VNDEKYIGLDVHQATIVVAVMDSTGKLVMESILETKAATILRFFAGLRGRAQKQKLLLLLASGQVGGVQLGSNAQPPPLSFLVKVKAVHIPWPAHLRVPAADSLVAPTAFFAGDADIQAD